MKPHHPPLIVRHDRQRLLEHRLARVTAKEGLLRNFQAMIGF